MKTFTDICSEIIGENLEIDGNNKEANSTTLKGALTVQNEAYVVYKAEKARIAKEYKEAEATLKAAQKAMKDAIWQHDKAKMTRDKELKAAGRAVDNATKAYDKIEKAIMRAEKKATK